MPLCGSHVLRLQLMVDVGDCGSGDARAAGFPKGPGSRGGCVKSRFSVLGQHSVRPSICDLWLRA